MRKKKSENSNKFKLLLKTINNKFLYGKYNSTYQYLNKKTNIKEYVIKFFFIYILLFSFLFILFNSIIYSLIISFFITIFFINNILLNMKKIKYESYILSQLSIYTSQMSLLVSYNNIYSSLKEVIDYLDYPVKDDLNKVIEKIDKGNSMTDSFKDFNEKYNNRTITLFNQTLDLFNEHGDSDASVVLQIISEELNMLKVKKDKFFKYKKEWRLNFYVVVIMCLIMPIILKLMIPDIYNGFMKSFGSIVMIVLLLINLLVISKVEMIYRNQSIGEEGYK